jgi:hypothetical protein
MSAATAPTLMCRVEIDRANGTVARCWPMVPSLHRHEPRRLTLCVRTTLRRCLGWLCRLWWLWWSCALHLEPQQQERA